MASLQETHAIVDKTTKIVEAFREAHDLEWLEFYVDVVSVSSKGWVSLASTVRILSQFEIAEIVYVLEYNSASKKTIIRVLAEFEVIEES